MRKKKLYVVGYDGDIQCVYGKDVGAVSQWAQPMTAFDAKRKLKDLQCKGGVIYKLVKVFPSEI